MQRVLLVFVVAASTVLAASPMPQFTLGIDGVEVMAHVSDGRRPARGLSTADFAVVDNGSAQPIVSVSTLDTPLDVTVLVDMSEAQSHVTAVERAVHRLAGHLRPADQFTLVTSTDRPTTLITRRAPGDVPRIRLGAPAGPGEPARINDALAQALTAPTRPDRRHVLIVFADGGDAGSVRADHAVLEAAGQSAATVFTVSRVAQGPWTTPAMPSVLKAQPARNPERFFVALTAASGGLRWTMPFARVEQTSANAIVARPSPDLIDGPWLDALDTLRSGYVIRYALSGTPASGWHSVRVTVPDHPSYIVQARQQYWISP